ncbi:MAG: hypothetical protein Q9169_002242 [Polycauliona sp. 2 TL-2023]
MPMVHRFDGHENQVKEFLWRTRGSVEDSTDNRDFQLVSWGTDRVLRLHRLDEEILAKVGYVKGLQVKRTIPFTRKNTTYKSFRGDPSGTTKEVGSIFGQWKSTGNLEHNVGMSSVSGIGQSRQAFGINSIWATTENPLPSMAGKQARSPNDVDAISWMRGVKIGKRETRQSGVDQSISSVLSPTLKTSQPWDTFDSLAEEITHLADKFSKVVFESIDMDDRRIVISLHGPWGPERASVFVKCTIGVPLNYPYEEPPWVSMENTAGMGDESILQATSDIQLISYAYQEQRRHSLEAILRYLLGERSRHDTLALLQASMDRPGIGLDDQEDFSSSDEDDETDHQYANDQEPGWESSDVMVSVSNAQYNVPLPKACGALWADNGRLVCFFPPKQDRPPSFLQPLGLKSGEWPSKNHRGVLEGFGRLQSGSSISKMTSSTAGTLESGDSDYDDSSASSSDSSSSNENRSSQFHLMPSMAWRDKLQESTRALSVDESQRSDRLNGPAKSIGVKSKNFVSILDCAELLPAKRTLAAEYQLNSTSESCLHNAAVARRYTELELADTWELLNLILRDEVPLQRIQSNSGHSPIMVVARHAVSPLTSKDSAIDLSYDAHEDEEGSPPKGPVYWGAHPFGSRWLVDALFDHFEQLADVQMLAMLACVLQSPSTTTTTPATAHVNPYEHGVNIDFQAVSSSRSLAATDRYYSFAESNCDAPKPNITKPGFARGMRKSTSGSPSTGSSVGASASDHMIPYSTGLTPPSSLKPNRGQHERSLTQIPLSSSPEQYRYGHRSSSTLASAFAASLVRPFSFSTHDSSSPPGAHPRKPASPAASYSGREASNSAWGKASNDATIINLRGSSSKSRNKNTNAWEKPSSFEVKLKNQDQFHNDGYAVEPLLDASKEIRYSAYRSLYASMLLNWGLPVASSKVLQYNAKGLGTFMPHQGGRDRSRIRGDVQPPIKSDDQTPVISTTYNFVDENERYGWSHLTGDGEKPHDKVPNA